jgi:tRNA(fMet)-specific endonuclease VapC
MTARYLLDSDICIYALSGRHPAATARFDLLQPGEAVISAIAYGELLFGASKSRAPEAAAARLTALTLVASLAPLPLEAAGHYAEIRRHLEAAGTPIGGNDAWIAAHARATGLVLVSNNEREFRRVPGLAVENWLKPGVGERPAAYRRRRRKASTGLVPVAPMPVDPAADLRQIARGLGGSVLGIG